MVKSFQKLDVNVQGPEQHANLVTDHGTRDNPGAGRSGDGASSRPKAF